MSSKPDLIPDGSITSAIGFSAGTVAAGIKKAASALDLAVIMSAKPCSAAAVFTQNRFKAAPVLVSLKHLGNTRSVQAIIVNAGCANAGTGEAGLENAQAMTEMAGARLGIESSNVLVASTGVIGVQLPIEKVTAGIKNIKLSADSGHDFSRAIMTTDTMPKEFAVRSPDYGFTIGGCAKGAGMIHPNLATLLGFITTDVDIESDLLQRLLKRAVNKSFNVISVDGDTSTNDSIFVLANGASGWKILPGTAAFRAFSEALECVCVHLAKSVARDGEGATKLIELKVTGAATSSDARKVARTVLSSPLVKTAVHGADPNWGRIVAAAGRSGARFDLDKVDLWIGNVEVLKRGMPLEVDRKLASAQFEGKEVFIHLDLGLGKPSVTGWGCDMSAEYIHINADYTT
ncbi:bifunctional glutamate N-acetyltransferase/amino-acid acetyltransferase ArgJ [Dehalogenimonas etheniformans]|uniref:Arginine biosynthesis bifunctional protein ArgJ n=1 Tax=Dehalogenimonas etheniformans TaxID=1536648 RepID=A0A2P5P5V4_9CHLR|nr:bifunctional glutamate N-acetyltransferase/amino-acid acetyltransferase ArgJ [Dehalogenimonas etheniformans]PPD57665.1 bifunctional glutamate N-acetyltransferase/amino-acid acetyltransferase ArgJ [Dehalogenimonas etheniformans]QNT76007.1 bifunctional glutamate N-acetyltransferase/amino-acid acetyltransferase ArgJ [Dehalogenimonas etheniformans]